MFWFNTHKAVDDLLDKDNGLLTQVGNWIGNMNLTPEEIMEENTKTVSSVQKFVVDTLSETTERSRARRSIAKSWIQLQVVVILLACVAAPIDIVLATFYYDLATSSLMLSVTTAITIFFFGSYGLARYQEKKNEG